MFLTQEASVLFDTKKNFSKFDEILWAPQYILGGLIFQISTPWVIGNSSVRSRSPVKNLPYKSPKFLAFFQRLCFYGYLEAFSGQVEESRPCLTFDFTYWDMFFDLKKSSGGCQEASESWHVLNFLSF